MGPVCESWSRLASGVFVADRSALCLKMLRALSGIAGACMAGVKQERAKKDGGAQAQAQVQQQQQDKAGALLREGLSR